MDKYSPKIAIYLEDPQTLTIAETNQLKTHLSTCPTCQAEYTALKQIDHLFSTVSMATPAPNFTARFEMRLERRRNKRRTWLGALIIGTILILATALLGWSLTDYNSTLLAVINDTGFLNSLFTLMQSFASVLAVLFDIITLMGGAILQIIRHPAFWGYVALSSGFVSLWIQTFRWFTTPLSVTA